MMSASSRTLRVITTRMALLAGSGSRGPARRPLGSGGLRRAGSAHVRPQREVDFRAEVGEARGVLLVASGELFAHLIRKRPRRAIGLLVHHQPVRGLVRGVYPEEPAGALHLGDRVLHAALELEDEHLLAGKQLEDMAEVLVVEAPPGGIRDLREQHPVAAFRGHALQAGDRRPVPRHGVSEHHQQPRPGSCPVQEPDCPVVGQIAGSPFTDDRSRPAREQRGVLTGDVVGLIALPVAIEVVNLLAEWRALDPRIPAHRVVPPTGSAALRPDADVVRGTGRPPFGTLGDLQRSVPWASHRFSIQWLAAGMHGESVIWAANRVVAGTCQNRRPMRLPTLKRARKRTGGRPPAPFVVGVSRSGTTLLRLMLDAHPDLTIPAETHFIPMVANE